MAEPILQAEYFDGHRGAAQPVRLAIVQDQLHIVGAGFTRAVPLRKVTWPERQRHGQRQVHLPDHGVLSSVDTAAWDAWSRAHGLGESFVVRWQQNWRLSLGALALLLALLGATYRWGAPAAAGALLAVCPPTVDAQLGDVAMAQLEQRWLRPSRLADARQAELRQQFQRAVQRAQGASPVPPWQLHFREAPGGPAGANALALPGGHIIVTDALVQLLDDRPDVLMGVLGHELGHLQHRHGTRALLQAGLLSALSSLVIGDFSTVLAGVPALLGQLAYAREAEFEADRAAARLMRANGWDPGALALLFERLKRTHRAEPPCDAVGPTSHTAASARGPATPASGAGSTHCAPQADEPAATLPIALSTHPPDAERVRRLRAAD